MQHTPVAIMYSLIEIFHVRLHYWLSVTIFQVNKEAIPNAIRKRDDCRNFKTLDLCYASKICNWMIEEETGVQYCEMNDLVQMCRDRSTRELCEQSSAYCMLLERVIRMHKWLS